MAKKTSKSKLPAADAPTPEATLLGEESPGAVVIAPGLIGLNLLSPSGDNPRTTVAEEDIATLAESIAAIGLLENLVVHAIDDSERFTVISGERRYRALQLLAAQGRIPNDHPVACQVRPRQSAAATLQLALTENVAREEMHPLDEAAAILQIVESSSRGDGATARLANQLGKTQRWVQMRVALLRDLVPEAREAWRQGAITLEHAKALRLCSPEEQNSVLAEAFDPDTNKLDPRWLATPDQIREQFEKAPRVSQAAFDLTEYTGKIVTDVDDLNPEVDERFADINLFWELQKKAAVTLAQQLVDSGAVAWAEAFTSRAPTHTYSEVTTDDPRPDSELGAYVIANLTGLDVTRRLERWPQARSNGTGIQRPAASVSSASDDNDGDQNHDQNYDQDNDQDNDQDHDQDHDQGRNSTPPASAPRAAVTLPAAPPQPSFADQIRANPRALYTGKALQAAQRLKTQTVQAAVANDPAIALRIACFAILNRNARPWSQSVATLNAPQSVPFNVALAATARGFVESLPSRAAIDFIDSPDSATAPAEPSNRPVRPQILSSTKSPENLWKSLGTLTPEQLSQLFALLVASSVALEGDNCGLGVPPVPLAIAKQLRLKQPTHWSLAEWLETYNSKQNLLAVLYDAGFTDVEDFRQKKADELRAVLVDVVGDDWVPHELRFVKPAAAFPQAFAPVAANDDEPDEEPDTVAANSFDAPATGGDDVATPVH